MYKGIAHHASEEDNNRLQRKRKIYQRDSTICIREENAFINVLQVKDAQY